MCEISKEVVCKTAYLIGVADMFLYEKYYTCLNIIEELKKSDIATKIRALCILRTNLFMNFKKTEDALKYDFKTFSQMDWFDTDAITFLRNVKIEIHIANGKAADYVTFLNKLIMDNISACADLYPDWVEWEYIKDLFTYTGWDTTEGQRREFNIYQANRESYPNKMYIHWKPRIIGDLLSDDVKFLKIIYQQHGTHFTMTGRCKDVDTDTKLSLNEFIAEGYPVDLIVDCENSDVYKLYAMLTSLDAHSLQKINKIILFDDDHTTVGWDFLQNCVDVNMIEHITVPRVVAEKSLVDMRMAMGISQEYYRNGVKSFILVASDSDYWGVISALPDAKFYCITENDKFGKAMCELLDKHNIEHCTLDDFNTTEADALKETVLTNALNTYVKGNTVVGINGMDLVRQLYWNTRITATNEEMTRFYNKYMKNITIKLSEYGIFELTF